MCAVVLQKLFEIAKIDAFTVSEWENALPEFSAEFTEKSGKILENLPPRVFAGIPKGAGLDAAAHVGKEIAASVLDF